MSLTDKDKSRGASPYDVAAIIEEYFGSGGGGLNRDSWTHGHKDVTAAGTAEQLPDVTVPNGFSLVVRAKPGNTGNVFYGNSKANAEDVTKRLTFSAGNGVTLRVTNTNLVWVDAALPGEGVEYWVET